MRPVTACCLERTSRSTDSVQPKKGCTLQSIKLPRAHVRLRLLCSQVLGLDKRLRDKRPSTLSVVTHLSDDRLHQLIGLCRALAGDDGSATVGPTSGTAAAVSLCVAVLVHDKAGSARVLRAIRALPQVGQLIVRVQCFTPAAPRDFNLRGTLGKMSVSEPCWYPINQLRNRALAQAKTDLVLICDVDFRPCHRLARVARATSEATVLLNQVSCRLSCLVLPAFEVRDDAGDDGDNGDNDRHGHQMGITTVANSNYKEDENITGMRRLDKLWWAKTLSSKRSLLQQWDDGRVVPFASRVWAQGHRTTNFDRWKGANTPYEVAYEEGFEPFVIMNRLLVPPFDERFEGYGRNKVCTLCALYCANHNAPFWRNMTFPLGVWPSFRRT